MKPTAALLPPSAAVLLGMLAVGLPMAVLPRLVHDSLGFGTVVVGIVTGAQSFVTLFSRPSAGRFSDRVGPKRAMLLGAAVASTAGLAYLLATTLAREPALFAILVGRGALGVAESLLITGALTIGMRRAGMGRSGLVMVWIGLSLFIAFGVGAPIGLAVYGVAGFAGVGLAAMVPPLLAVAVVARLDPAPPLPARSVRFTTVLRAVAPAGAGLALSAIGYAGILSFLPLLMVAQGWGGGGVAFSAFAGGFVVARLLFSSWPDTHGHRRVAVGFLLVEAVGQALLAFAPVPLVAELGAALTGAGYSIAFPALGIEAVRAVAPEHRGVAVGTWAAFLDFGLCTGAPLLGALAGLWGLRAAFVAGTVAALLGAAIMLALALREEPATAEAGSNP